MKFSKETTALSMYVSLQFYQSFYIHQHFKNQQTLNTCLPSLIRQYFIFVFFYYYFKKTQKNII